MGQVDFVLLVGTQTRFIFPGFGGFHWYIYILFLGWLQQRWNISLMRVIYTVAKKVPGVTDSYLAALRPRLGFRPVSSPLELEINIESSSSDIYRPVDCFCFMHNYFHLTTFLNVCSDINKSAWRDFQDGSGMNWSEASLHTFLPPCGYFPCWKHGKHPGPP